MPPHVEYRVTLALNVNHVDVAERRVLFVEPSKGTSRFDYALGVQEAFVDYHLRNVSDRYDFDSVRVGIQPFQLDFRGFLFNDQQLGLRLFGNRDNNRFQYNLMAIWRLEKDTNSGLNNVLQSPRKDWIVHANLYRQDFPFVGLTSQASLTLNVNRERGDIEVDDNGFPVRPALIGNLRARNYEVAYLGYSADGRFGRINLSASAYGAFGWTEQHLHRRTGKIQASSSPPSRATILDWMRFRGACCSRSGDGEPFDDMEGGFDPSSRIRSSPSPTPLRSARPSPRRRRPGGVDQRPQRHPQFAALVEGAGQSKLQQSSTILLGAGADFDISPDWRLSGNVNHLWFHKTAVLELCATKARSPATSAGTSPPPPSGAPDSPRTSSSEPRRRCFSRERASATSSPIRTATNAIIRCF